MKLNLLIGIIFFVCICCKNSTETDLKSTKYYLTIYKQTINENSVKMSETELIAKNDSIAFTLSYSEFCEKVAAYYSIYTQTKRTTSVPYKFVLKDNSGKVVSDGSLTKFNIEDDILCNPENIKKMIKEMTPNLL